LTFFTKDDPQEPIPIDDEENDSSKEEIEKIKTSRLEVIEQKQEGRQFIRVNFGQMYVILMQ